MSLISKLRKYLRVDGDGFFTGNIQAANFSGTTTGANTGDVTLAAFGSAPATPGASLSSQVLTLQPADATHGGGVSTTTQTLGAGVKTFSSRPVVPGLTISPTASGANITATSSQTDIWNEQVASSLSLTTMYGGIWNNPAHNSSFFDGAHAYTGTSSAHPFQVRTNNIGRLTIFSGGNVAIGSQSDGGHKLDVTGTIAATGAITGSNLSGTNTGDVTIGTANGLSISGQALSLAAAVSSGASGALTGADKAKIDATSGTNSGDVTIGTANGLSLSSQALSLAAAIAGGANGALLGTDKTKLDATTGTNSGDVTIGTANGLSLSGQALSLAAAVAAGASGALTGADKTKLDATSGTNSGDLTLATVGSSPANAGASLSGQVLTLQPADATHGGVLSTTTQTIVGAKTVSSVLTSSVASNADAFAMSAGAQVNFGGRNLKDDGSNLVLSSGAFVGNGIQKNSSSVPVGIGSQVTDVANRHAVQVYCSNTLSAAGTNLVSFENPQNTQIAYMGPNGEFGHKYTDSTASPGAATINKPAGKSAIAATATSVVITNSVVAATDIVHITPLDIDTTISKYKVAPGAGAFTVTVDAAATATWKFSWQVVKAF